jgi:menaquinone-dependent protoporphyrinogen oxidase
VRVLVTYGSKRGGTAGIAETIARALAEHDLVVEVHPARDMTFLDGFNAVVLGGAVYANRWSREARGFARRFRRELMHLPVWMFSSGPLDASAEDHDIAPVPTAAKVMGAIGARGHITFGGRLLPDAQGFPASAMAKAHAGDWRDERHVREWAASVAAALDKGATGRANINRSDRRRTTANGADAGETARS